MYTVWAQWPDRYMTYKSEPSNIPQKIADFVSKESGEYPEYILVFRNGMDCPECVSRYVLDEDYKIPKRFRLAKHFRQKFQIFLDRKSDSDFIFARQFIEFAEFEIPRLKEN